MTTIGRRIAISGTVRSDEPLAVEGTIKGDVLAPEHEVTLESEANVDGTVLARAIIVNGNYTGKLVAKEMVRLRAGASVKAEVSSPHFAMEDGAVFNGKVDPAKAEAAVAVAGYRDTEKERT
jgi:cytoskeletal protein CcmA (bactofilin family)